MKRNARGLAVRLFYEFARLSPILLVSSIFYAVAGGYVLWLVDKRMSLFEAYARHIEAFFSMRSPLDLCCGTSMIVAFASLILGWLFIPALVSTLIAEGQQQLLEQRLAERELELALIEILPESLPNRLDLGKELSKKTRQILLGKRNET